MHFHDGLNEYLMPLRSVAPTFARLDVHRRMLGDRARVEAFARAIAAQVGPDDVVVEIGTGVGLLAALAARAGARRVYAIEVTEVAEVARAIVARNGLADRVQVLRASSFEAELPERGGVLITETLGHLGIDEGIVATVADARARLLAPGARLIPRSIDVVLAPTSDPGLRERELEFWRTPLHDLDLAPAAAVAASRVYQRPVHETALAARPRAAAHVDLASADAPPACLEASFVTRGASEITGIAAWFEADLGAGVTISSRQTESWVPLLFPIEPPLPATGLAECLATVESRPVDDEVAWSWTLRCEGVERRCGR